MTASSDDAPTTPRPEISIKTSKVSGKQLGSSYIKDTLDVLKAFFDQAVGILSHSDLAPDLKYGLGSNIVKTTEFLDSSIVAICYSAKSIS